MVAANDGQRPPSKRRRSKKRRPQQAPTTSTSTTRATTVAAQSQPTQLATDAGKPEEPIQTRKQKQIKTKPTPVPDQYQYQPYKPCCYVTSNAQSWKTTYTAWPKGCSHRQEITPDHLMAEDGASPET
ncbi:hypothetical protein ACJJTC_010027 [Scirpophaga incertulas]